MIHFFQFNALQLFNTVNIGARVGHPTLAATSVSFFFLDKECIYSVTASLYDQLKTFQMHVMRFHFSTRHETNERGNGSVLVAACALMCQHVL